MDLLQEQGPEEPVISSTGKQPEQVVARSITPEEMLGCCKKHCSVSVVFWLVLHFQCVVLQIL